MTFQVVFSEQLVYEFASQSLRDTLVPLISNLTQAYRHYRHESATLYFVINVVIGRMKKRKLEGQNPLFRYAYGTDANEVAPGVACG